MHFFSPLRYPGGKRKLAAFVKDIIVQNNMQGGTYVEPFAGGAAIALYLLFNEHVRHVVINDIDRSIYAFWYCVLNYTSALCDRIERTVITMEEWEKQKLIQNKKEEVALLDLAFSTFFLNRTNRSGIIKGGVIGGRRQSGQWKMDARFNKDSLIKRIEKVALYKHQISLYCADSIEFVNLISRDIDQNTLVYFDPPYYRQGSALYVNHYTHQDHEMLSKFIKSLNCNWILTYDNTPEIVQLYHDVKKRLLTLSYTASKKIKGSEILAFSNNLIIPEKQYSAITIKRLDQGDE